MSNAAPATEIARVDWFHRTEKRYFKRDANADATWSFDAPVDATLEQLLAQGYALGIPKGSARGGCYELQTVRGIWSSPRGRMSPRTATFKTWEQLEQED